MIFRARYLKGSWQIRKPRKWFHSQIIEQSLAMSIISHFKLTLFTAYLMTKYCEKIQHQLGSSASCISQQFIPPRYKQYPFYGPRSRTLYLWGTQQSFFYCRSCALFILNTMSVPVPFIQAHMFSNVFTHIKDIIYTCSFSLVL